MQIHREPELINLNHKAFTLVELMAVVAIILILLGGASVIFMNGRDSVKIRSDANHLVSFMKSMLDYTKATGVPLVIQFNPDNNAFSYVDPRNGETREAKLTSKAKILAIKLNERLFTPETLLSIKEEEQGEEDVIGEESSASVYISEGRGLITMSMLLAIQDEDEGNLTFATLAQLNLISGKGKILQLKPEEVQAFFEDAEEAEESEP